MTAVATDVLGRGSWSAAGWRTFVTCPAGITMIVKSVVLSTDSATDVETIVSVFNPTKAVSVQVGRKPVKASAPLYLELWVVLTPGDLLVAYSAAPGPAIWVSGSVLVGESGYVDPAPTLFRAEDFVVSPI